MSILDDVKGMITDVLIPTAIIGLLVLGPILLLSYYLDKIRCSQTWGDTAKHSLITGCLIKNSNGTYIPESVYREIGLGEQKK